jgi:chromosome segregation protein
LLFWLKLSGFKSFVEPAELRIEPGLTGVVGPNGCGKSNLLEAIRWVMGESSPKSLRGGGMEDVIFAGTAAAPAARFRRSRAPLRGRVRASELEVVRRIERGAGSAYRVNGRDVRAKDVALVFRRCRHRRAFPGPGQPGQDRRVIAAKPAERRMMLEEAAGIAGLHVRRKDAEQKLRATEANLARLEDIMGQLDRADRIAAPAGARGRALQGTVRQDPCWPRRGWSSPAGAMPPPPPMPPGPKRRGRSPRGRGAGRDESGAGRAAPAQPKALAEARDELADRRDDAPRTATAWRADQPARSGRTAAEGS